MKKRFWHKITVSVPVALETAGSSLLWELGAQGVWVEEAGDQVALNVFFPENISVVATEALIQKAFQSLVSEDVIAIRTQRLPEENWQIAWQTHSIPVQDIGKNLKIAPPWEKSRLAPSDRKTIVLSPGMAFGTGTHPTTRICLMMLEDVVLQKKTRHLLDVGTGSGILSIAAAKLGVKRITATEIDTVALVAAKENARCNRVLSKISFRENIPEHARFDCVIANLTTSVLGDVHGEIMRVVMPDGYLILSGMLKGPHESVLDRYQPVCSLLSIMEQDHWVTLLMQRTQKIRTHG